jgi:hypothetical protein
MWISIHDDANSRVLRGRNPRLSSIYPTLFVLKFIIHVSSLPKIPSQERSSKMSGTAKNIVIDNTTPLTKQQKVDTAFVDGVAVGLIERLSTCIG